MERIILHCDIKNCYTSIECAENKSLIGKALAICTDNDSHDSIILASSPEAKKFGVQTGENIWNAKFKCPDLIIIQSNFDLYSKYSKAARNIYYRFTNKIESFGLNECWLDVTESSKLFGTPEEMAKLIKQSIKKELGISISIGISFNKAFAKIASSVSFPGTIKTIDKKNFKREIWPMSIETLIGINRQTIKVLNSINIKTIGEIATVSKSKLIKQLGKLGEQLWEYANGLEDSPVSDCDFTTPVKSIGHGITTVSFSKNKDDIWHLIFALSETISSKLRSNRLAANGIQITIRDNNFKNHDYQCMLVSPTQNSTALSRQAFTLLTKNFACTNDIRSISVRAIHLVPHGTPYQMDLRGGLSKNKSIQNEVNPIEKLQSKFGSKIINYSVLLYDQKHNTFESKTALCI